MRKYVLFLAVISIIALTVSSALPWPMTLEADIYRRDKPLIGSGESTLNSNKDVVLPIETWIKIGEERQIFYNNTGIVRRYYADPNQRNGVGSTMSVYNVNAKGKVWRETMFWKGWNLYTNKARYALLFKGSFYLEPAIGPANAYMMTLSSLADLFRHNGIDIETIKAFQICLMDSNDNILNDDKGDKVCYTLSFEDK